MFDIDMENYGRSSAPAAVEQVDTNSYAQLDESPVDQALVDSIREDANPEPQIPDTNSKADNFRALREEVDRIKAERDLEKREHQLQLDMLRANLDNRNVNQEAPKASREMFDGMDGDDVPSVAEIRKEWQHREAGYQARLEELQVQQAHPDYAEVIEKHTLPLLKQKPHLLQGLQHSENKALFAYELGKMAQQISAPSQAPTKSAEAQKIVDNSRKPGTLSQAGGQGSLSKADYFATMSDQEFMKYASRNLEGI